MPPSSAAVRSLAFAVIGVGAASVAAHGQNVTAFNPYSGAGLAGGSVPRQESQSASSAREPAGPAPTAGPAFNPWSTRGQTSAAHDPAASLPPPPQSPIKSRIVAIPELTKGRGKPREIEKASAAPPAKPISSATAAPLAAPTPVPAAPAPVPAVSPAKPVAPPPVVAVPPPASAPPAPRVAPPTPQPAASMAAAPSPKSPPIQSTPAAQQQMAALAPSPPSPPTPSARNVVAVTLAFAARSTELSDASKAELDRLAKDIIDRTVRQLELRTIADNGDPDSRKISLARALIVRSYLIDKGVRSRIEIASIVGDGGERVEILVPST